MKNNLNRLVNLCVVMVFVATQALPAWGFGGIYDTDPGHHEDIALFATKQVFPQRYAVDMAKTAINVDNYLYSPNPKYAGCVDNFECLGQNLHLDGLSSSKFPDQVQYYLYGTLVGLEWAKQNEDYKAYSIIMGTSLHPIADILSHSSWMDNEDLINKNPFENVISFSKYNIHTGEFGGTLKALGASAMSSTLNCYGYTKCPEPQITGINHDDYSLDSLHDTQEHCSNRPLCSKLGADGLFNQAKAEAKQFALFWTKGIASEVPLPEITPTGQWYLEVILSTPKNGFLDTFGTDDDIYIEADGVSTLLSPTTLKTPMLDYNILENNTTETFITKPLHKCPSNLTIRHKKEIYGVPKPVADDWKLKGIKVTALYKVDSEIVTQGVVLDNPSVNQWINANNYKNFDLSPIATPVLSKTVPDYAGNAYDSFGGSYTGARPWNFVTGTVYPAQVGKWYLQVFIRTGDNATMPTTTISLDTDGTTTILDTPGYMDFEEGDCDAYYIGPLDHRPTDITLRSDSNIDDWKPSLIKVFAYYVPALGKTTYQYGTIIDYSNQVVVNKSHKLYIPTHPEKIVTKTLTSPYLVNLVKSLASDGNTITVSKGGGAGNIIFPASLSVITPVNLADCLSYNPANLKIVSEGSNGWLLTDGRSRMLMLDNQNDANAALAMAKQYTSQCFIGRNNNRPNRKDYIVRYWGGNSGIATTIPNQDCISYNTAKLSIKNEGANGWLLTDGRSRMLMLDNEQDAKAALEMAKKYTQQCFIGRNNKRPNRKDYIIQYWK